MFLFPPISRLFLGGVNSIQTHFERYFYEGNPAAEECVERSWYVVNELLLLMVRDCVVVSVIFMVSVWS